MKFIVTFFLFCFPVFVFAHEPVFPTPTSAEDRVIVEDANISRAYYGTLSDYPQTYEISFDEPSRLFVQVLEPDIKSSLKNMSGIVVRQTDRGVKEVARLSPKNASWESEYEPFGGDSYLQGVKYDETVEAGTYLVEVSNPDNLGKYVLVIGYDEDFSGLGYFATLKKIYQVKRFFGKTALSIFQSPFYYVPTFILFALWLVYRRYKKRYA